MKASISFPEIQNLILEKAKQPVFLDYVDGKTFRVTYPFKMGFIKKDISANLIIKNLTGSDLLVQLATGFASDMVLSTLIELFKGKIPEGLVEKCPDSHLLLHLGQIEQLQPLFEKLTVNNIQVLNDGVEVEGSLK